MANPTGRDRARGHHAAAGGRHRERGEPLAAGRRRRGRRHPPRGRPRAPGGVPHPGRLSHRRGAPDPRLPAPGPLRHPHRGPRVAGRRAQRAGVARPLLPQQPGPRTPARRHPRRLPLHQHRRLRVSDARRGAHRPARDRRLPGRRHPDGPGARGLLRRAGARGPRRSPSRAGNLGMSPRLHAAAAAGVWMVSGWRFWPSLPACASWPCCGSPTPCPTPTTSATTRQAGCRRPTRGSTSGPAPRPRSASCSGGRRDTRSSSRRSTRSPVPASASPPACRSLLGTLVCALVPAPSAPGRQAAPWGCSPPSWWR